MKKLNMRSHDLVAQNIEKIAELFPNCMTEAADEIGRPVRRIDFDLLRQELSGTLVEGPTERFRLDWPGKRQALLTANAPIANTLRPDRVSSVDFDTTQNLYIEGDNLDALKLLQENYLAQVKMIYIDPPYNTGHDFIYRDKRFASEDAHYQDSAQKDEEGNRLVASLESDGRFHSNWLSMMYSRLKLARNLLRDDGVIFISIDDNEMHNLRKLCDEIFGKKNFIATIVWQKKFAPQNDDKYLSDAHDYILMFAKSKTNVTNLRLPRDEKTNERFDNPDNDPRGPWASTDLTRQEHRDNSVYPIVSPSGKEWLPTAGTSWRHPQKEMNALIASGQIWFGKDGGSKPRRKKYLADLDSGIVVGTFWVHTECGHNQEGTQAFKALIPSAEADFSNPKPVRLLKRLVQIVSKEKNDIVLDFFSGSATTAHAIMQLNAEDGGRRRFIMIQLPEVCDGNTELLTTKYQTIADIGRERIRRAGKKILENGCHDNWNRDIGFRSFKIDSSNMADVYYTPDGTAQSALAGFVDNIKPGRNDEDLLFQVMLDWGLDLAMPLTHLEVAGAQVWLVGKNDLAACFEEKIDEEVIQQLAAHKPALLRVVFRESSFPSDSAKINLGQIFKQLSPNTDIKVL